MIKEEYVSFEVAKLLKEKGFTEECEYFYDWCKELESYYISYNGGTCNNEKYPDEYSMPTHQMAMAWLREKYNIYISIQPDFPSDKDYKMCWCWTASFLHENCVSLKGYQCYIETYEKATEEALKYCLKNLI